MSSAVLLTHLPDPSSSFREDAPRPPVPGEEGETPCQQPASSFVMKSQSFKAMSISSNPRRNEDGLGEPEGSASPDSPLARWTKSLHSLLGDQDGACLFRTFLEREKCVDTLDFWFACNGFRQMDLKDTKTLRVAKAIYKRYIENNSIVSKQLKPATKTYIRDNIKKQQIDSIMFDQAQTEIQTVMEENAYQMFLTSDIYLEYVRSGGENPAYINSNGLGTLKVVCGYLPTLNEEEEWSCVDFKNKILPSVVGLSSKTLRVTANVRATETAENGYRSFKRNDPINPYHVNSGYVFAPGTSANDSEISSDALTDDSMSMTDSSVDGIPPYRLGSKKQLQREMHRSVKANGQVSLPHFPVSLMQSPLKNGWREGPLIMLDIATPGRGWVKSLQVYRERRKMASFSSACYILLSLNTERDSFKKRSHLAHFSALIPRKLRSEGILQGSWYDGSRIAMSTKKAYNLESTKGIPGERPARHHLWGNNNHPRGAQPAHPFVQDPTMPPLTPPNTLAQLEEACRRLAEVSKPPKQRCSTSNQQRDRNHSSSVQGGNAPFCNASLTTEDHKEPKKLPVVHASQSSELVVTYFFCGEEIPYRRMLKAQSLTLGHFKEQLSKKGNYRYYFKKASDEFDCGAVFEEIWEDDTILPMYEGRILGKVERID
ncbi:axin-2 [Chelonoidis abingdonii]|uniref:axin-2 n=1 Tax=Chelonoidis abingdonii TaxID=106734 RepID=UPI003F495030